MFAIVKRKSLLVGLAVVLAVVCACWAVTAVAAGAYAVPKTGKTIIVDAGHGGADGGVIGTHTGSRESDINLAIARSLRHFLRTKGYEVVMTRSTTDGLYGMSTKNKKLRDMEARKKIINESNADFVISIHCNAYPLASSRGAQVFYAPGSEEGKANASVMQNILNDTLSSTRKVQSGDYFILQCSTIPSLLVECGFLSNPVEEKLLISAPYQEKVAYAVYAGIHAILSDGSDAIER